MLWKVPAQASFTPAMRGRLAATWRTMRSTRRDISTAARREKVSSRITRVSAMHDEVRHAVRQDIGLARTRAGDHQQRGCSFAAGHAVLDGTALLRVQAGQMGVRVGFG